MKQNIEKNCALWERGWSAIVLIMTYLVLQLLLRKVVSEETYHSYAYMAPIIALLISLPILLKRDSRDILAVMLYVYCILFICCSGVVAEYWGHSFQSGISLTLSVLPFLFVGTIVGVHEHARLTKQSLILERPVWYYLKKADYGRVLLSYRTMVMVIMILVACFIVFIVSKK